MMTLDDMIAVIQAYKAGETLEVFNYAYMSSGWREVTNIPAFNFDVCDYRIKHKPKLHPWKPEEVPLGAMLRDKSGDRFLIVGASSSSLYFGIRGVVKTDDMREFECSYNHGKTWLPCGVAE